jgi:hypothetical protein
MTIAIGNYNFEGPFTTTNALRNESGVYAILGRAASGQYVVLDIGESGALRDRVRQHDRQNEWARCGYSPLFVAAHYTGATTRPPIERLLRAVFKPTCGVR